MSPISGQRVQTEVFRTEKIHLAKTATKVLLHDCTTAVEGLEDGLWSIQFWQEDAPGGREGEKPHV